MRWIWTYLPNRWRERPRSCSQSDLPLGNARSRNPGEVPPQVGIRTTAGPPDAEGPPETPVSDIAVRDCERLGIERIALPLDDFGVVSDEQNSRWS